QHRFGKLLVHLFIMSPIRRPEQRPSMCNMAKRPQAFIGKAVVIAFFFLFAEPYPPQSVLWLVGWDGQPVVLVYGFAVGIPAAMGDPGSVARLQNWFQRSDESAGWYHDLERL